MRADHQIDVGHADARGREQGGTVPVHGTRDPAKGTLRGILNEIGLTIDELGL